MHNVSACITCYIIIIACAFCNCIYMVEYTQHSLELGVELLATRCGHVICNWVVW